MADPETDNLEDQQNPEELPWYLQHQAQPRSITGTAPPMRDAGAENAMARPKSVSGAPPATAPPAVSITGGVAPVPLEPPPDTLAAGNALGTVPGGPSAAATGPNLPQDILAGNVQQPQWKDYKPAHVSLGRKILALAAGGLTGMQDPKLGAQMTRSIAYGPQLEKMGEDTEEYKGALGQGELGEKQQAQERATEKEKSEENFQTAESAKLNADAQKALHDMLSPEAKTDFEAWQKQNPNAPVADWLKAQAEAKPNKMEATTLQLPGGEKVAGKKDENGNLILADGTPAPKGTLLFQQPNYGQLVLPTKTQTMIGPDNLPHDYSYNEKTQKFDIDQGVSGSGPYAHQMEQAGASQRMIDEVVSDLHTAPVGNLQAWAKSYLLGTPIADPQLAGIDAKLMSVAALQPALHQFRSTTAMQAFEKIVGGLAKNPEATIASLEGLRATATAINPKLPPSAGGGTGKDLGPAPAGKSEGSTGTMPDGTKVIVKGGRLLTQ